MALVGSTMAFDWFYLAEWHTRSSPHRSGQIDSNIRHDWHWTSSIINGELWLGQTVGKNEIITPTIFFLKVMSLNAIVNPWVAAVPDNVLTVLSQTTPLECVKPQKKVAVHIVYGVCTSALLLLLCWSLLMKWFWRKCALLVGSTGNYELVRNVKWWRGVAWV